MTGGGAVGMKKETPLAQIILLFLVKKRKMVYTLNNGTVGRRR
jgi:hypothetical protein